MGRSDTLTHLSRDARRTRTIGQQADRDQVREAIWNAVRSPAWRTEWVITFPGGRGLSLCVVGDLAGSRGFRRWGCGGAARPVRRRGARRGRPTPIKGADKETPDERPVATVDEVYAIADVIRPPCRCLVLLAGFTGIRWGELTRLRRRHLDLAGGFVKVPGTKSEAARREVGIPATLVPEIRKHLAKWAEPGRLAGCSSDREAGCLGTTTSSASGTTPCGRPGSPRADCTSTTCGTRRTASPHRRPASGS
jgi:integrase